MIARIARCEAQMWVIVEQAAALGASCVIDCGFSRAEHRSRWVALAQAASTRVRLHHLAVDAAERWRRVQVRNRERGETYRLEVTREMFDFVETLWEPPDEAEMRRLDGVLVR